MNDGRESGMYVQLGRSATRVSRLWLGTVNFSGRVPDGEALRVMDAAFDRGINCVDTADIYGWRLYKGHTEELVGQWLARGPRRDDVVVATKVGEAMGDGPNDRGLSARRIIASCEASLRRLGTEHIDLYQMHRMDRFAPWEEVWQAMDQLVASGKVRYVGSSNFAGWHLAGAQESAARRGSLGLVTEQCLYNLAVRHAELEIIPAARAYGVGVFPWSPLHGGMLSGALQKLAEGTAVKSAQGRSQQMLTRLGTPVEQYERLCERLGLSPAEAALSWLLSRPGVSGTVIGPRNTAQLDSALRAMEMDLGEEVREQMQALFPPVGTGGEAPEAWQS
ncbi:oxidoreductase [Nocardiopsis kunsanensis]|uniref:Oxidoreductase n=1 Tax=Nocardiopsis kunsanensis TaxID=141693 RepID=A0A919CFE9_9ACTN|nr:aldo/keto reductase [Nocardiopsis kunsanensis]GHD17590.1 oxidoreductase [Nocardiopsis kunsanensis]